jgi:hypothetical protein
MRYSLRENLEIQRLAADSNLSIEGFMAEPSVLHSTQ